MSNESLTVVLVGFGGLGREMLGYLTATSQLHPVAHSISIRGYLDDQVATAKLAISPICYLGTVSEYRPESSDRFLIAVGKPADRARLWTSLVNRGAVPFTYIHPTAIVASDANIAPGCIVAPHTVINAGAMLEKNCIINVFSSVGHAARVGSHSVLSPYSAVNGQAALGAKCFMGTRATLFPGVTVGDDCTVDSHSMVKQDVPGQHIISCRPHYLIVKNRLFQSDSSPYDG